MLKDETPSYYLIIPGPVKSSKNISAQAKLLFGEIMYKTNLYGYSWATNQFYANALGCDVRSIQRYLTELENANFVMVEYLKDEAKGTARKIRVTDLSHRIMTDLSPLPGMTDLSQGVMTGASPPNDNPVTPPHDNAVTHNTNTSLIEDVIVKTENKEQLAPPNGNASPAINGKLFNEPEKPKNGKSKTTQATGAPSLFKNFIAIYSEWFKEQNDGTPPKIDGGNGNAAKTIISYLKQIVSERATKENEVLNEAGLEARTLEAWEHVLKSWGKLEPFYQDKTRLLDINSNIQNIIKQIKNGKVNGNHSRKSGNSAPGLSVKDYASSANAKFSDRL
jgi:hypothetical protein